MPVYTSRFSFDWKRHPSDHPDGHPVNGFTRVYVPSGQDTKSVRKKTFHDLFYNGYKKQNKCKKINKYPHWQKQ